VSKVKYIWLNAGDGAQKTSMAAYCVVVVNIMDGWMDGTWTPMLDVHGWKSSALRRHRSALATHSTSNERAECIYCALVV